MRNDNLNGAVFLLMEMQEVCSNNWNNLDYFFSLIDGYGLGGMMLK